MIFEERFVWLVILLFLTFEGLGGVKDLVELSFTCQFFFKKAFFSEYVTDR